MNYKEFFKEEMIVGRRGKKFKEKDVDAKQLAMGIKVEMEHTKDKRISKRIALDHLAEDPLYYTKLKKAGLANELDENSLFGLTSPLAIFPDKSNSRDIVEPDVNKVDKQTEPGTVYPKVEKDPINGLNMQGTIGSTSFGSGGVQVKTDVETPPSDPTPTKHVTGGMEGPEPNPNILPKSNLCGGGSMMVEPIEPQDISIDIKEGKKILKKMLKESVKGPATAFGPTEGFVPAAGDPDKDPHYVKGKRWTVKYGHKTPTMKETDDDIGDYNREIARQVVKTVVDQSSYNEDEDMGSILAYLHDQGINISDNEVERMYRQEVDKKMAMKARRPVVDDETL